VKYVHDEERSAIEQNNVAPDHDMFAIRRRRRQTPLEVARANHNFRSQPRRQSPADDELALQAGWQAVPLRQSGRQVIMVLAVPAPHLIAVVVGIGVTVVISIVPASMPVAVIVVIVAIMLVVAVPVPLGYGYACRERESKDRAAPDPQPNLV
jgi:hypothetical protein